MKTIKKMATLVVALACLAAQSCGNGNAVSPQAQAATPQNPAPPVVTPPPPTNPINPTNPVTPPANPTAPIEDCGVKNPLQELKWLQDWIEAKRNCTDTLRWYKCVSVRTPYMLVYSYHYNGKLVFEINECPTGVCNEMKIIRSTSYIPTVELYNCKGVSICANPATQFPTSPCADFLTTATNKTLIYKNY
jgi:hypothetical protein